MDFTIHWTGCNKAHTQQTAQENTDNTWLLESKGRTATRLSQPDVWEPAITQLSKDVGKQKVDQKKANNKKLEETMEISTG